MSVQPSLNNSNMVVAEIINEINSTQPPGNYSQSNRATPIQRQPPQQQVQRAPPTHDATTNATTNATTTATATATTTTTKSYTTTTTTTTTTTEIKDKHLHLNE